MSAKKGGPKKHRLIVIGGKAYYHPPTNAHESFDLESGEMTLAQLEELITLVLAGHDRETVSFRIPVSGGLHLDWETE